MALPRFGRSGPPLIALCLVVAYAATAWFSLEYLRAPNGRVALYTANAFLLSGLVLLQGRARLLCLLGCMSACAGVVFLRGAPFVYAAGTGVVAGVACLVGEFLVRRILKGPRIRTISQALKLLFFGIMPCALTSGILSALWINIRTGAPILPGGVYWFAASFMGVAMVLPALLMIATPPTIRDHGRSRAETIALGVLIAALVVAPHVGFFYIAMLVALPAANLLALRLGGRVTASALLLINLSAFIRPFIDSSNPVQEAPASFLATLVLGLQIYTLVVFYNGLLTALAIDHQTRIKRHLERRTMIARRARAEAIEASRAKTEFLATMSHEVRTPLNSILGFSQLLERRDDLAADARRQVVMIQRAGESLLTIVNDILDFSRVEAGKLALDPRPADVVGVAEESLAIVAPAAAEKGLSATMAIEGQADGRHLFDDQRVRQVLLNFLNNAVKFTETGGVHLTVSIRPVDAERDRVRFTVTDTGVGIAKDALPRLFKRFSQADGSISRSYGGAGLGLSICKGLAELMGGTVGVESAPQSGSAFWLDVVLPRACGGAEDRADDDQAPAISARVLLVDDNAANRELGATVLAMLGCDTDTATDGAEAVEAARIGRYDIILMDVHMPGMDGLAATRAIRALEGPAGLTPIVAMSADVLPEQVERCRAAGMVDHVAKPIDVERLYACLQRWTGSEAATGERTEAAA